MIRYINVNVFFHEFPLGKRLDYSSKIQNEIYISPKYVVKKFIKRLEIYAEIYYYEKLNHPCIIKPIAWALSDDHGYLVISRGEDIMKAFRRKLITKEKIISDILSALVHMHSLNISHGDIKEKNIIFLNEKATLIDMGNTIPTIVNSTDKPRLVNLAKLLFYGSYYRGFEIEENPHIKWLDEQIRTVKPLNQILSEAPKELIVRKYPRSHNGYLLIFFILISACLYSIINN